MKATNQDVALEASWRMNAAAWTAAVRDRAIESRRVATDAAVLDAVLRHRPSQVLDLGCGEGWLVRALAERGVQAVGVDGSAPLIDAARQAGGGTFLCASYADLIADPTVCGGAFDAVVANFALLQEDVAPLLDALWRIMRDNAVLLIQTLHPLAAGGPYEDGWRAEDFRAFTGSWAPMPWYFRTLESWLRLLRDSGFILDALTEPRHPDDGRMLSLLMEARRR